LIGVRLSDDRAADAGIATAGTRLRRDRLRIGASLLLFALAYILFITWQDPAIPWPVTFNSAAPWATALLNAIPVLLVHSLLIALTRRVVVSAWITFLALALLYLVNSLKLQSLATPLLPDDFHFLRTLGVSYSFFSTYLLSARTQLAIAAIVLAFTLLLFREPALRTLRGTRRAAAAMAAIMLGASLLYGIAPWTKIYDPARLHFEPWAPSESAARTGVITNILLFYWELRRDSLHQPDLTTAAQVVRAALPDPPRSSFTAGAEHDYPDIIVLQSESLFDPTRLVGISGPVLSRLNSTAARSASGDLYVPTFGGGTIRTEFEALTGLPLSAFPQARFPYLQLMQPEIPGLTRVLAKHGYRTLAIHPNAGAFWNRNRAFGSLGFDRFADSRDFAGAELFGRYVSDAALGERIIAELSDEGPPQLVMAISIQNHGPYTPEAMLDTSAVEPLLPVDLIGEARTSLATYLALILASDEQLGKLVDYVQQRERRTLLLFYSDHLPPLNDVFAQTAFTDGKPATQQPALWLLFDNRSQLERSQRLPSWLLPVVLLDQAGVPKGSYFDALAQLASQADAFDEMFNPNAAIRALAQLQYWRRLGDVIEDVIE
jgi:phosphoglycerol transferase MdoB-like AlkP superfamily enzyme